MFFEEMFGNLFGLIWLILFSLGVIVLLIWMLIKKDSKINEVEENNEIILINYKNFYIEKKENNKFEISDTEGKVIKNFVSLEDAKFYVDALLLRSEEMENEEGKDSLYEIFKSEGFFKVRKKGSERTLRKFDSEEEALNYVKEKENNDWSKINRQN